jgi:hypothetical protein
MSDFVFDLRGIFHDRGVDIAIPEIGLEFLDVRLVTHGWSVAPPVDGVLTAETKIIGDSGFRIEPVTVRFAK